MIVSNSDIFWMGSQIHAPIQFCRLLRWICAAYGHVHAHKIACDWTYLDNIISRPAFCHVRSRPPSRNDVTAKLHTFTHSAGSSYDTVIYHEWLTKLDLSQLKKKNRMVRMRIRLTTGNRQTRKLSHRTVNVACSASVCISNIRNACVH